MSGRTSNLVILATTLGFAFLYLPIALLVLYSFNESGLVTTWGGFSTKWHAAMLENQSLRDAAWVSVRVAMVSATVALCLGTLAALALVRYARFRGRTLFTGMVTAPLVMPEVIAGLALVLLFVALEWAHGYWTVVAAHITFSMAYVAVLVQARLVSFDKSIAEAARDLGASPSRSFFEITLPLIAPALIAGWLLAFALSLGDLVLASFTAGPDAATLPMEIYSAVRLGVSPEINAVCAVLIGLVTVGVLAATLSLKHESWHRQRSHEKP